jgi:hypothetical protein
MLNYITTMKSIIIIGHEPLTKKIASLFHIKELIDYGFSVNYWDVSNFHKRNSQIPDSVFLLQTKIIRNLLELETELCNLEINKCVFIVEVLNIWRNRRLFHVLKKHNCYTIKLQLYAMGQIKIPLKVKLASLTIKTGISFIKNRFEGSLYKYYQKKYNFKPYDFYISSKKPSGDLINTVLINHNDYDLSQLVENETRLINYSYAIFLEECHPSHPDYEIVFGEKPEKDESYFDDLNDFFTKLEKFYNLKVVIALHPKSNYNEKYFANRRVIKYETAILVRDAEFVIMHGSTSFSYAIINRKPIIIVYTDNYRRISRGSFSFLINNSKYFKVPLININQKITLPLNLSFDIVAYDNFKYTYLTSKKTENKLSKDILIRTLKEL